MAHRPSARWTLTTPANHANQSRWPALGGLAGRARWDLQPPTSQLPRCTPHQSLLPRGELADCRYSVLPCFTQNRPPILLHFALCSTAPDRFLPATTHTTPTITSLNLPNLTKPTKLPSSNPPNRSPKRQARGTHLYHSHLKFATPRKTGPSNVVGERTKPLVVRSCSCSYSWAQRTGNRLVSPCPFLGRADNSPLLQVPSPGGYLQGVCSHRPSFRPRTKDARN